MTKMGVFWMKLILNRDEISDCDQHGDRPQYQLGETWGICDKCLEDLLRSMIFKVGGFKVRFVRIDKRHGSVELVRAE